MAVVTVETIFDSSPQKVWEAITKPEMMKVWYFDISNFNLQIGNEFTFYEPDGNTYFHKCKILKVEENKLLQHTWTHPEQSKGSSVVIWKIEAINDEKVKVTLTHEGLETFADGGDKFAPENYEMGWNALVKTNLRNYLYNIEKIKFTIVINTPASKVWDIMWNKELYTKWTTPFCVGSYFTGELAQGCRIHFLSPSGSGMYSDVFYLIPEKLIIFKHIGNIADLKELPLDAETEKWTGSFETYKFDEVDGKTTVTAEVDCVEQYIDYMKDKFPLALAELKRIVEK